VKTNTRLIFKILLRRFRADCVLDIGSCDGSESLVFRQILPKAVVVAFEPNPFLYRELAANSKLRDNRIEILPYAANNRSGRAAFYVTELGYKNADGQTNPGTSSLLIQQGLRLEKTVEVETTRVDEFLLSRHPEARRVGLWIAVEGAEFEVLQGIVGVKERVVAIHVETANRPMRGGQKVYTELATLLKSFGFSALSGCMSETDLWGDVVFVKADALANLGWRYYLCRWVGGLSSWCGADSGAIFLRKHCFPLYRFVWRIYARLFT